MHMLSDNDALIVKVGATCIIVTFGFGFGILLIPAEYVMFFVALNISAVAFMLGGLTATLNERGAFKRRQAQPA